MRRLALADHGFFEFRRQTGKSCHGVCSRGLRRSGWPGRKGKSVACGPAPESGSSRPRTEDRVIGRVHIQTDDVATLGKLRIIAEFEVLHPVWLQFVLLPDSLNCRRTDFLTSRHGSNTPMRGILRGRVESSPPRLRSRVLPESPWAVRCAADPPVYPRARHLEIAGATTALWEEKSPDCAPVRDSRSLCCAQDNVDSEQNPLRSAAMPTECQQLLLLRLGKDQLRRCRKWHKPRMPGFLLLVN